MTTKTRRTELWHSPWVEKINDERSWYFIIFRHVLPLFAVALLGIAVQTLFGLLQNPTREETIYITTLLSLIALVAVLTSAFVVALRLIALAELSSNFKVTVSRDYPELKQGRSTAYDFCSAVAKKAKESIVVVGPHFSSRLDQSVSQPGTSTHDAYLEDGMSAAVERHSIDDDPLKIFQYTRIIQVDPGVINNVKPDGAMESDLIGNKGTAQHLKKMLSKNLSNESVRVEVYARDYIPSFPSILIVDKNYLFFSLPTYLTRSKGAASSDENLARENLELEYDFVLGIEDRGGEVVGQFKKIISQFTIDARHIRSVK